MQPGQNFPAEYMVTDKDAAQYVLNCALASLSLYVGYFLLLAGLVSPLALFALVLLVLPRWIINVHELLHIRNMRQINYLIRLMGLSPVPLSPLTISYEESRQIHYLHHRFGATEEDPDAYHIRGQFLKVFLNAFITPEQNFWRWVVIKGINFQLCLNLTLKLALLGILAWLGTWNFLWFWLSLRLVNGIGDLIFFRLVHYQNDEYGTFQIELPAPLISLGELIFSKTVLEAIINHDVHHQNPLIAARHLGSARAYLKNKNQVSAQAN